MKYSLQTTSLSSRELLKLYRKRHFIRHFALKWLLAGAPAFTDRQHYYQITENYWHGHGFLMASDLHKRLKKILPDKIDNYNYKPSRTQGKYGSALLYMFETPSFYIAVHCETKRGSSWSYLDKDDNSPATDSFSSNEVQELPQYKVEELCKFFRYMWWQLIQPHLTSFLGNSPSEKKEQFIDSLREEFLPD